MTEQNSEFDDLGVIPEAIPEASVMQEKKEGYSNILRVKADPPDITPEERKKRVKNLAGAIAHGLRQYGEVYVRCFSNATCGKAQKP